MSDKCYKHDFKLTFTCAECWAERAINEQAELHQKIASLETQLAEAEELLRDYGTDIDGDQCQAVQEYFQKQAKP